MASPTPQLVFHDNHAAHNGQQQSVIHLAGNTVLDILGERPEFSKLLGLIQKDNDLRNLLGDPATQPTLFAPTNEAFDSVDDIDYPTHDVLMYHIAAQPYNSSRLHDEFVISTLFDSDGLDNSPQRLRITLSEPGIPSTSVEGVRNSLWKEEPEVWISEKSHDTKASLYVNRAKVILPDLLAQSGGMVHGVNCIIRPPGETILDEVMRHGMHFTYLTKAWTETGVDGHIRDGKSMTLFAAHDKAWKALPKKLFKWLFSDMGREHLKILSMYQIANKVVYTPEILNKTNKDGKSTYPRLDLHTLLNSPAFELHVQGKVRKSNEKDESSHKMIEYKPLGLTDLIETFKFRKLFGLGDPTTPTPCEPDHHFPHKDLDHPHKGGKHHSHRHHGHHRKPKHPGSAAPRRDDIVVNGNAEVIHGLENWIAGNGVIHVVDKVLMPPRRKGCEKMTALECSAWETIWDLGNVGLGSVVEDSVDCIDDMTLFDDIEGVLGKIKNPFQPLWSADEDVAEMAFKEEEDDYGEY
ncbi:hypothetical protein KI688_005592 [Linnemannia hyalina]|uniref:FAS1 domain-containing protein n=1 Tax=Linnemannia hyalina TaxID=64524 RepID=A0A9P8BXM1_9FUNG|nr:hypothetical protein KI688_005592 [Linnemannia hyalina]